MPIDPAKLPEELVPYADALDIGPARPRADVGWQAHAWPAPVVPLIPGAPPYDDVYRASWISPGVCVRLDLNALPGPIRTHLTTRYADRMGDDGGFYEFGIVCSSQLRNREKSWPVLQAGQYHYVTLSLSSAESLAAFAHPYDFNGDIDVHLYKWDSYQGWVYNKGSALSSGYIDSVFTPPYTAGWAGSYLLMFHCYSGTCNFRTSVSIGDDSNFYTSSVYLNQRSFTAKEQKCQGSSGAWVANGECMCAPSSAAMALVAGGKRNINELGSSAVDLFTTNNSYGAADRVALMNRLKSNYGYGTCEELSATMANIRDRLRYKYLVLFRSKSFSSAGHYVQVRGYATASDGTIRLRVNDPMGAWLSKDKWNPQNSTTTGYGQDTWLKFADITTSNPSIIACK